MGKPASESRQSDDIGRSALSRRVIETETRREVHPWNMIASKALVRLALCLSLAMELDRMVNSCCVEEVIPRANGQRIQLAIELNRLCLRSRQQPRSCIQKVT